jgi:hypothetical protein
VFGDIGGIAAPMAAAPTIFPKVLRSMSVMGAKMRHS